MSIRRKSTTHDLATLRLHPDGSRVQQSSINRRSRKAQSTVPDIRGNWIARDAGGRADVSKIRTRATGASASAQAEEDQDKDKETFDTNYLSGDDDLGDEDLTVRTTNVKGKQKATESDDGGERTGKNFRARKRRSFTEDLSFLAPSPYRFIPQSGSESKSSSEDTSSSESESTSERIKITFPDPSPELLKCIHHFSSRYYQEKGVLSDRSRGYRDERKARLSKKAEANIHYQTTTKPALWTSDSSLDRDGEDNDYGDDKDEDDKDEDDWEDDDDDDETEDAEEGENTAEHLKDMYKALDGSALVAIGIILQEQIAHAMTTGFSSSHSRRVQRRDDSGERSSSSS